MALLESIARLEVRIERLLLDLETRGSASGKASDASVTKPGAGAGAGGGGAGQPLSLHQKAKRLESVRHLMRELSALVEELGAGLPASEARVGAVAHAATDQEQQHARHKRVYGNLLLQVRKASLSLQQQQDTQYVRQREQLLATGKSTLELEKSRHRSAAALLRTTKDVTSSLKRSRRVMADAATRMQDAAAVLDQGSQKLDSTYDANKSYAGTVRQSKALLRKLEARNRTDQILNAFGIALFLGVAAYIVYKRTVGRFF